MSKNIVEKKFNFRLNRTTGIRHLCRKTSVLSYHRCAIDTGVEKMKKIII
jgi:hypothetical protein